MTSIYKYTNITNNLFCYQVYQYQTPTPNFMTLRSW